MARVNNKQAGSLHRASSGSEVFTVQNQNQAQPVLWFVGAEQNHQRTEVPGTSKEHCCSVISELTRTFTEVSKPGQERLTQGSVYV